jgi:trans-2-enoyl-CoA reductase
VVYLAIASVVVAVVAAAAYAIPKMYWYVHQIRMLRSQQKIQEEILNQPRDYPSPGETFNATGGNSGQYL